MTSKVSMHLLVLSAFRHDNKVLYEVKNEESQCTFWCSVLSDTRRTDTFGKRLPVSMHLLVLSAFRLDTLALPTKTCFSASLNAPFGAQCFPTGDTWVRSNPDDKVSMHLLVLSAFRLVAQRTLHGTNRVSMHLLVLSAFRQGSPLRPL